MDDKALLRNIKEKFNLTSFAAAGALIGIDQPATSKVMRDRQARGLTLLQRIKGHDILGFGWAREAILALGLEPSIVQTIIESGKAMDEAKSVKVDWETFTRGKYTEYRMIVDGRMILQLIPTAYDCVPAWEARTSSEQYRVDASTPEEAKAKVERQEWTRVEYA